MSLFVSIVSNVNSSLLHSVCNRFAAYVAEVDDLSEQLAKYRNVGKCNSLPAIEHVIQHLVLRCCNQDQLRNLLLATARSSCCLIRAVLMGCQGREDELSAVLIQLAHNIHAHHLKSNSCLQPELVSESHEFATLTVELLRLTDDENGNEHSNDSSTISNSAAGGLNGDKLGIISAGEEATEQGAAEAGAAPSLTGDCRCISNTDARSAKEVSEIAQIVMQRLEATARACCPEALHLMAQAVSERLYPLDPGLACRWALRQVQAFCIFGASHLNPSMSMNPTHQIQQRAKGHGQVPMWQRPQPALPLASAFSCAPYLVSILGLPLVLCSVESELLKPPAGDGDGSGSWRDMHCEGAGVDVDGAATGPMAVPLMSGLLAAVAALGQKGEEAVWDMLGRVLAEALCRVGDSAGGRGAGFGAHHQTKHYHHQQQQQPPAADVHLAAAALVVAEGVVLADGKEATLSSLNTAVVAGSSGAAAAIAATRSVTSAERLEALLRPLLLPSGASDIAAQRLFDAVLQTVQLRVKHASSQLTLAAYERVLLSKPTAANTASAPNSGTQQQQHQYQVQQRRLLLALVRSRMQHLSQTQPGGGGGGCQSGSSTGPLGTVFSRTVSAGDPTFAMQCLSDFSRQGQDHLSKMAGLYRTRWLQAVKPVMLRPTLDEQAARLRYSYLKDANERFRLISDSELDGWEKLHEKLGVTFEGAPRESPEGGIRNSIDSGGGGEAVLRRPVDDLLRRLASVGPSLAGTSLEAVMGALEAALAEELSPRLGQVDTAAAGAAAVEGVGGARPPLQGHKQQSVLEDAAEHIAELVLEAFVGAEELELPTGVAAADVQAAPGPGATITTAATASTARSALRRRQSHLAWQLRLLDAVSRWTQLHAHLAARLLELASTPELSADLDEPQVLGLAAALAAMSCVCIRNVRQGATGDGNGAASWSAQTRGCNATSERYMWQLSGSLAKGDARRDRGCWRGGVLEGVRPVPGPMLALAVLEALPLGPSARQLRFSATFMVAYLRHCSLMEAWVLYHPDGAMWVSPSVEGGERRRRQQQLQGHGRGGGDDLAGCVPVLTLGTLVWIHKYVGAFGGDAEDASDKGAGGQVEDSGRCWAHVRAVCDAFMASGLGNAMMGRWAEACKGASKAGLAVEDGGGVTEERSVAQEVGAVGPVWDEPTMVQLTRRALAQGLQLPRKLLGEQASLLWHYMAHPQRPTRSEIERMQERERSALKGGRDDTPGVGLWDFPEAKRVRAL